MKKSTMDIKSKNCPKLSVPVARRTLAMHYFPSPTAPSAVRRMSRWLADDPSLLHDLEAVGYRSRQRWFTRKQLEVFRLYFGD